MLAAMWFCEHGSSRATIDSSPKSRGCRPDLAERLLGARAQPMVGMVDQIAGAVDERLDVQHGIAVEQDLEVATQPVDLGRS